MVCAIFNPFCCCTAGVLSLGQTEAADEGHSCCKSAQSDLPLPTNGDHDPNDCSHKALKEYQATALKDASPKHLAADDLALILTLIEVVTFEPVAQSPQHIQLATASQAPPPARTHLYCIYRI